MLGVRASPSAKALDRSRYCASPPHPPPVARNRGTGTRMRTYLAVIDDTAEAELALRFAARRAAKTGGTVLVLALIEPAEFVAWGGVQATMEDEARQRAEGLVASVSGSLFEEA